MRELKYSTKAGKNIVERATQWEGDYLWQVYYKWSEAKQRAFDWCYEQFCDTEDSDSFGICSHNTFGFTCSWLGKKDGEDILRYETKDNSYLVWLER